VGAGHVADRDAIVTRGVGETRLAGQLLAALLRAGDVVALTGGLGAGKTAFVQGMAAGLGVAGHVPSPTFNILLVHRAPLPLYHFDLYRLDRAEQLVDIDFYATLESDGVTAIEWADRFVDELPTDRLDVGMEVLGEARRAIRPVGVGPRSKALARAWTDAWREYHGGEPR
jgi:tRNA threonylcarbamoyladenosine biosynthesis protein TsaE